MSDFTAIGQLVTEARNLLDSIKGGAIRKMETAFDAFMVNVNSQWAAKKSQVDNEALAAIGRVDTETVRAELGFTALNYNGDFIDTKTLPANARGDANTYPIGAGIRNDRNECFKVEMIPVVNGADPAMRHPEAKTLLDYMGIGRDTIHFSKAFNIMKLTVLDTAFMDIAGVDFVVPDPHIKNAPASTFMAYTKIEGDAVLSFLGGDTGGTWKQINMQTSSDNVGSYFHVDINFSAASVGDVVYLALPTLCAGHFPKSKKHGLLYSTKTELVRKINGLHE
ncbi:phage tail protein [Vibrio sp. 10N.222.55.B11]|uniref:phage tail protein n=1 Tax=Vibrio sp. 10N.222.55.B11 TaxID=3229648 RepID=UPI00354C8DD2